MRVNKLAKQIQIILGALSVSALTACGGGSGGGNQAPSFGNDTTVELQEDTSVDGRLSATDLDGDPLSYTVASAASNGSFELSGDGSYTYTPDVDFFGTDTVSVQVSDGELSANTQIMFTVINVNDAPVLQTTSVAVASQGESSGVIEVNDVDGDDITFAVINEPENGALNFDTTTGEFTYTPASLEQIDTNFEISFTDGIIAAPINAIIALTPSFVSNADKLNYYYSSEFSHLKQAEALLDSTNDQSARDNAISKVAKGYFASAFEVRGQELIDSIQQADLRAEALREAALQLDRTGQTDAANALREDAIAVYNFYLSQKGLSNVNSSDANFYQSLVGDYLDADSVDEAENLLSTIRIYADAVNSEEYEIAFVRFYVAASGIAGDLVERYQQTKSETDHERALIAVDFAAYLADNIGYRERSSGRDYRTRAFFMDDQAKNYYLLRETEKAKDYVAKTLALFTEVNYDAEYSYSASPYAANTYASSLTPVEIVAGLLEALYPKLETNPALAIIDLKNSNYEDAQEEIFGYQIANDLRAGMTVEAAVAPAYDFFVTQNHDLRSFYEVLFEENLGAANGKAARILLDDGNTQEATALLDYAFTVLMSEGYITNNANNSLDRYVTGDWGCYRLIQVMHDMGQDVVNYQAQCVQATDQYIASAKGYYTTSNAARAFRNLIAINAINGNDTGVADALSKGRHELSLISEQLGNNSKFERHLDFATMLASRGYNVEALAEMEDALAIAHTQLDSEITEALIEDVMGDKNGNGLIGRLVITTPIDETWQTYSLLNQIRRQAGMINNYQDTISSVTSQVQAVVQKLTVAAQQLGVNQQQGLMEDLVKLNGWAGLNDEAKALVSSSINAPADVVELSTVLAEMIATKDDFPASDIAVIDTDNDGMPTFFLLSASEEAITASGLTADEDSDNDGIADSDDLTPLGE